MPGSEGNNPTPDPAADKATAGHHDLIGQPHDARAEGTVAEAEKVAADISTDDAPMGRLGPRFNWRSPFFIGLAATAGVAVTVLVLWMFWIASDVFLLIGVALFLAVGMDPAVSFLVK